DGVGAVVGLDEVPVRETLLVPAVLPAAQQHSRDGEHGGQGQQAVPPRGQQGTQHAQPSSGPSSSTGTTSRRNPRSATKEASDSRWSGQASHTLRSPGRCTLGLFHTTPNAAGARQPRALQTRSGRGRGEPAVTPDPAPAGATGRGSPAGSCCAAGRRRWRT